MLKLLYHHNVVRYILCFFSEKDRYFDIVMDYVDGGPLWDQIGKAGNVPLHLLMKWLDETASALNYVHSVMK